MKSKDTKTSSVVPPLNLLEEETTLEPRKRVLIKTPHHQPLLKVDKAASDTKVSKSIVSAAKERRLNMAAESRSKVVRSPALAEVAFTKLERIVGGKDVLIEALHLTPPDKPYSPVIAKLLADPELATAPLWQVAMRQRVSLNVMVQAYRDAKAILLHLEAIEKLAKKMPLITAQIAEDSTNRYVNCEKCKGEGRHEVIDAGEFVVDELGNKMTVVCMECRGEGKLLKEHSIPNRKLAVDIVGLVESKPLVQQTFDQRQQTVHANFVPGDGNYEQLMKATDKLLRRPSVQPSIDQESSSGDRVETSDTP